MTLVTYPNRIVPDWFCTDIWYPVLTRHETGDLLDSKNSATQLNSVHLPKAFRLRSEIPLSEYYVS